MNEITSAPPGKLRGPTRTQIRIGSVLVFILVAGLVWVNTGPRQFVKTWSERFQGCRSVEDVKRLPESEFSCLRRFKNEEWVAVASEHSCCSGAGFDATVFADSRRRILVDESHSFCGFEGLVGELPGESVGSLNAFYAELTDLKLKLKVLN